jgi:N-methylhydantoinase A
MVAFGGAGRARLRHCAQARYQAHHLPTAPASSAIGLLIAPVAVDLSASFRWASTIGILTRCGGCRRSGAQGSEVVSAAGVAKEAITNRYTVDMRYVGQGHEITVALPNRSLPRMNFFISSWTTSPTLP